MNILVIGGTGFIGSALVDSFIMLGHKVRVFSRGAEVNGFRHPSVEYISASFSDSEEVKRAVVGVDIIYHALSSTVPSTSNANPVVDIDLNLINSVKLLEMAVRAGVDRIIFISSGGTVYGPSDKGFIDERQLTQPISSYGIVKLAIENYMKLFFRLYGLKYTVLRVSNPYGPNQGNFGVQGIIGTVFKRINDEQPLQIWGDGAVVRDYIYISDLIAALVAVLSRNEIGIFNVGSGVGTSVNELMSLIQRVVGRPIDIDYVSGRSFDVPRVVLDVCEAQRAFGWSPQIDLESGITTTWNWWNGKSRK